MDAGVVTSAANPLLKEIRRASARGTLTADGYAIAETFHLLDEALRSGREIKAVVAAESARDAVAARLPPNVKLIVVPDRLFESVAATDAPQGVLALVKPPAWNFEDLFQTAPLRSRLGTEHLYRAATVRERLAEPLIVVIDGVQDPGNAGAILRSAEAFGATGAVCLKATASPYNPKAIRASAGSVFRLPCVTGLEPAAASSAFNEHGLSTYAAAASGAIPLYEADFDCPCAVIIGSEGHGISETMRAGATAVRIPTSGVESLNAAMAATVLLYEAWRQRNSP